MHSAKMIRWASLAVMLALGGHAFGTVIDDDVPEVTDRVARISYLEGDSQVRRGGSDVWEKAVLNLPLVQGDEISTSLGARLEIQFDDRTHLRMGEDTALKLDGLRDEGIAVSVPQGRISVHVSEIDPERVFFEIDAPGTTVSVQRAGTYRIDAGQNIGEIRVSVTDDGEARVYSKTSGFGLKSGRSARVFIEGNNAGEWQIDSADSLADSFDTWASERAEIVAERLKDAHYNEYYDRDIYGAEELTGHGDWIHLPQYGYVWRPYTSAVSQYTAWSPYRYGHWRWLSPYGWTWINDEPWGWATYHHGRWFYENGHWYWTPYGQYRWSRSWWSPALVAITIWNNNICWYPLHYSHRYYDFNRHNRRRRRGRDVHVPTTTSPLDTRVQVPDIASGQTGPRTRGTGRIPAHGVVTVGSVEFGRRTKGYRTPTATDARVILEQAQAPDAGGLPDLDQASPRTRTDTAAEMPGNTTRRSRMNVGAGTRVGGQSVDRDLRTKRIFGGRTPTTVNPHQTGAAPGTGAVERPVIRRTRPIPSTSPESIPSTETAPTSEAPRVDPPRRRLPRSDETPGGLPPRAPFPRRSPAPAEQPKSRPTPRGKEPRTDAPVETVKPRNTPSTGTSADEPKPGTPPRPVRPSPRIIRKGEN